MFEGVGAIDVVPVDDIVIEPNVNTETEEQYCHKMVHTCTTI